ncbi:MAG: flotillin family protein, partial [Streptococcaceae bacterium]|nr:flotillin family protein [Streptococcaceae bacterium]
KVIRGGGTFVLPIIQKYKRLSLLSSKLDVITTNVYTSQGVPISVEGVVMIKIGSSIQEIATAAEQYLGKPRAALEDESKEVLEGHLRAIIGTMTVENLYKNRDEFAEKVQDVASTDLVKMGLAIVSFTVKEISDKNDYLEALGRPQIAQVKRDAVIAEATATKETRIKKAQSEQEAQQAELERQTQIAESLKEKELKLAEYKQQQDQAQAIADQAYKIQEALSMQETTDAQMQVEITKRKRETDLEEQEIIRKEREYDANVRKKADADKYAQIAKAEANKAELIANAEAEAEERRVHAEAEANAVRVQGDAEAARIAAVGKAEAERIRLTGEAEAEALEKKAVAMTKLNEAGKLNMVLEVLPQIVAATADNLGKIDSLNLYGGEGTNTILGLPETNLKRSLDVLNQFGLDVPELIGNFTNHKREQVTEEKE